MMDNYITLKEANELSGREIEALKKQCQEGRIRGAIKKGKAWFVPRSEVIVSGEAKYDGTLSFMDIFITAAGENASAGVTVIAGGQVISGQMVSRKEYLHAFRDKLKGALPFAESESNPIHDVIDQYTKSLEDAKEEGLPGFLHIKDYSIATVNDGDKINGAYIRIKYSSIEAFTLGEISKENGVN